MQTDAERLAEIRARIAGASTNYALSWGMDGVAGIEAVIAPGCSPELIATVLDDCPIGDRDLLINARADLEFLDQLVRRHGRANADLRQRLQQADRRKRQAEGKPDADYAAECAMKCADRAFVRWLIEQHGLDEHADDKKIATRVRSMLASRSRGELNNDLQAANRWRAMVRDFENWRRR